MVVHESCINTSSYSITKYAHPPSIFKLQVGGKPVALMSPLQA
jgi:hypothetical protein